MKTRSDRHQRRIKSNKWFVGVLRCVVTILVIFSSNFYLQLSQNDWSWELASNFTFSWHTEKFLLGCLVLFFFWLFLMGVSGSWRLSLVFYLVTLAILGFANAQKMMHRLEPVFPDDLKMITELGLMKEMAGTVPFLICIGLILVALVGLLYAIYRSFFFGRRQQIARICCLLIGGVALLYVNGFNNPGNLLREQYNKTAKWVSYSQRMNYYNTGFIGGFLYNLKVSAMPELESYSAAAVEELLSRYQGEALPDDTEEQPNIVFVMAESFSDPLRLSGVSATRNPLAGYQELAASTYSGQMLSNHYGGGTANIEFEALTGLSLEPLTPQMTTPYTMLIPKLAGLPSIVSLLNERGYTTTAIHPFNTSMYKRKDVYNILGFDEFIAREEMEHQDKLENNGFIADKAAYAEILDLFEAGETSQFVHLVTMQMHLPYDEKYPNADFGIAGFENPLTVNNYLADLEYSSAALLDFITELEKLDERTLIVFWGDHLPSFHTKELKEQNREVDMRLTEFLLYDTAHKLSLSDVQNNITSPIYFGPQLFEQANLGQSGFYKLLSKLETVLPAFEKGFYYVADQWQKELELPPEALAIYEDYRLIQYDLVAGKQYSLKSDFFGK